MGLDADVVGGSDGGIVVERGDHLPADDLLDVLRDGYARSFTPDWFDWKHRAGPWGPSKVWVARDRDRLVGVVFGLPWDLRVGEQAITISRLVDATTVPGHLRRGILGRMVRAEVDRSSPLPGIVLAAATPQAQASNVKSGAVALDPIRLAAGPVVARRADLEFVDPLDAEAVAGVAVSRRTSTANIATAWTPSAVAWRLDPRSGYDYRVARLRGADDHHGVVYRLVSGRGVTMLVVAFTSGPADTTNRVVAALAWHHRALAVHRPEGAGTTARTRRLAVQRGDTLLCVWDRRAASTTPTPDPTRRENWALQGIDLEGTV